MAVTHMGTVYIKMSTAELIAQVTGVKMALSHLCTLLRLSGSADPICLRAPWGAQVS